MCEFVTASIATIGGALQTAGLAASVVAPLVIGSQQASAAQDYAADLERQSIETRQLGAIEDQRVRGEFRRAISRQRANTAERGFSLGSPTAEFLGQTAAEEMAFASQSVRQGTQARSQELTSQARAARSRGRLARLQGGGSAAARFLSGAPDVWPELLR